MTSDWLPGLPDHPCVCDVLVMGREYKNCRVERTEGQLEARLMRNGLTDCWVYDRACQWRPIPVPDSA